MSSCLMGDILICRLGPRLTTREGTTRCRPWSARVVAGLGLGAKWHAQSAAASAPSAGGSAGPQGCHPSLPPVTSRPPPTVAGNKSPKSAKQNHRLTLCSSPKRRRRHGMFVLHFTIAVTGRHVFAVPTFKRGFDGSSEATHSRPLPANYLGWCHFYMHANFPKKRFRFTH